MSAQKIGSGALDTDTIVAVASANGRGGVGIVRLSGPQAFDIAAVIVGELPNPRVAGFTTFRDGNSQAIDSGIVIRFEAPGSFTGEDVVELQGHGAPVTLQMLVKASVQQGARLARPGEFSERAYLNGKLDLAQAEAVADLIAADSEAGAQAALRSLRGEFSKLIHALADALTALRVQVEAAIDFPDEDIELLADPLVRSALDALVDEVAHLRQRTREGVLFTEGVKMVLLGAPNVGKSSVLNRLCGADRAIVTAVPGTTRDLLQERIHLNGIPVELVDTAGLRASDDVVEQEGVRRAEIAAAEADLVIAVFDASNPESHQFVIDKLLEIRPNDRVSNRAGRAPVPQVVVGNKVDLIDRTIVQKTPDLKFGSEAAGDDGRSGVEDRSNHRAIWVSAKENTGFDVLTERLVDILEVSRDEAQGVFSARTRHLVALDNASVALSDAQAGIESDIGAELVAEHLRYAQNELGTVCGELTSDALLGEIFSSFCIGK